MEKIMLTDSIKSLFSFFTCLIFLIYFFLVNFLSLQALAIERAKKLEIENEILERELAITRLEEGARFQMMRDEILSITIERDNLLSQVTTYTLLERERREEREKNR